MNKISTTPASPPKVPAAADATDWPRLRTMTDADIAHAAADDPDTSVPDAEWMKNARVATPDTQQMVTLRLDPDVLT